MYIAVLQSYPIHHKEKYGNWYIYLLHVCFVHKNSKRAYKNTKKNCQSFKLDQV